MAKIHIVNHTHWDREWYFTTADALVLSENCFTEVINELEKNTEAKFCLDGQSSILEDYLKLRPEKTDSIKKLVKEKRLAIGPWYTQPDVFFVNGESIIKNLIIGIYEAKNYGDYMKIGYLPDTFGINSQMPTILKNTGIDNIIFWRGISLDKHVKTPYFKWSGLSGAEITAISLIDGYSVVSHLKATPEYIESKLIPTTKRFKELTQQDEIMLTAGGDQLDIVPNIHEKLSQINAVCEDMYILSSYEEFMDIQKNRKDLESYVGEFREPCFARVHKSIGSVRYDIKRENYLLEEKLLKRIEPLMAIARANGVFVSEGILRTAWKKILEGQAHDSMGGCISDDVHADIIHRFKEANEIADAIENLIMKLMAEKLGLKENEILIFNTTPASYSGRKVVSFMSSSKNITFPTDKNAILLDYIEYVGKENLLLETPEGNKYISEDAYVKCTCLINVNIPSMGYTVVSFEKASEELARTKESQDNFIENNFYNISIKGSNLSLKTKDDVVLNNFLSFEDMGNDGDTYDFSPLRQDKPIILNLSLKEVKKSPMFEEMILSGDFKLPKTLQDRIFLQRVGSLSMVLSLKLFKDSSLIECNLKVNNEILSHRLRLRVNSGEVLKQSIASTPFGYIKREVQKEKISVLPQGYVEMPIDIEPFDANVSCETSEFTVNVFGKGVKEYQVVDNHLNITMFATTGELGKPNLLYRPGRASGDTTKKGHIMIATPKAELLGKLEFEFGISINAGKFDGFTVAKLDSMYKDTHISYQLQTLNKFINRLDNKVQPRENIVAIPREFSLFEVSEDLLLSSFSPSMYDEDSFLLRFKNMSEKTIPVKFKNMNNFESITKVNYIEEPYENQNLEINMFDTITLKCKLKRN
ncbi:MAG: alpha-mannosidase [Alphaproteobacteria bacterium]|jgi:alpha-mannosidase|nr:alpha-mannosidase [Alphaproteobacteria bacterium]